MELDFSRPGHPVADLAERALAEALEPLPEPLKNKLEQLAARRPMSSEALAITRAELKASIEGRPVDGALRYHRSPEDRMEIGVLGPPEARKTTLLSLHAALGTAIARANRIEGIGLLGMSILPVLLLHLTPLSLGIPAVGVLAGVFAGLSLSGESRPNPFPYGTPAYRKREHGS